MDAPAVAATLPMQPVPVAVKIHQEEHPDGWVSVVSRLFAPGDGARCRLCPRSECTVDGHGLCQVTYYEYIPDHLAALYPFGGLRRDDPVWLRDDRAAGGRPA